MPRRLMMIGGANRNGYDTQTGNDRCRSNLIPIPERNQPCHLGLRVLSLEFSGM